VGKRRGVIWSPESVGDLAGLHDRIAVHDGDAADSYVAQVLDSVEMVSEHPRSVVRLIGVPLEGEFRSVVVRNHRVVYRLTEDGVRVYRIWDCRQDPAGLWSSLEAAE